MSTPPSDDRHRVGAAMDLRFGESVEEFLAFLADLGFDHVELKREYLAAHPEDPTPGEVRELTASYDASVTYHAPFRDWNVGSFDETVRRQSVERVRRTLDDAREAGAVGVVVHGGGVPRRYPDRVRETARRNARRSLQECADYATEVGVPLCLENQPESPSLERFTTTPGDLTRMIEATDASPEFLKATLDVGHAKVNEFTPSAFRDELGNRLHVVHLHDNDGTGDHHDPLPEFEGIAASLGAPYNVLEMKSLDDIVTSVRGPTDHM